MSRRLPASQAGLSPNRFNLLDHPVNLAMSNGSARILRLDGIEHFREVAWARTNMQNWGSDTEEIVNLARVPEQARKLDEEVDDLRLQRAEPSRRITAFDGLARLFFFKGQNHGRSLEHEV